MHQHREPADLHRDTPNRGAELRKALIAAVVRWRLEGLADPPPGRQPSSARAASRPSSRNHSWLHTASHAAVYAAVGLHLLHRRSHRGH
jgi:hypothetical protein